MNESHDWTTFYDTFFAEHPEWLTDVRYRRIESSDRPEMVMSIAGTRAFVQWVQAHPFIRYSPKGLASQLAQLDELEALQREVRRPSH